MAEERVRLKALAGEDPIALRLETFGPNFQTTKALFSSTAEAVKCPQNADWFSSRE